ncbi:hypothetical protein HDV06_001439 [Boothiomyces sp. JEL0866]|nr:hypothetical protein HDV06_001439 [Boothiomyces sp. JEL0866]
MLKAILLDLVVAQSTYKGFKFDVSGKVYSSKGLWSSYTSYIQDEKVNLAACINDCQLNPQCTAFTYNGETCTFKDVRLDDLQLTTAGAFSYDVTGFIMDKNVGCSDNNGQISCDSYPDNSGLTNAGTSSKFQGFSMTVNQGMYYSTGCNFQQSNIVMNATVAGNESEATCRDNLKKYSGDYAYSYDTKNNFCFKYDLGLQNLTMVANSTSNCGFYLPSSQSCYDNGSNVLCSVSQSANNTGGQASSSTPIYIGVAVGAVVVVIVGVAFLYLRKKSANKSAPLPSVGTPAHSVSTGVTTPTNSPAYTNLQYYPGRGEVSNGDPNSRFIAESPASTTSTTQYMPTPNQIPGYNTDYNQKLINQPTYPNTYPSQLYVAALNPPHQAINQNYSSAQVPELPILSAGIAGNTSTPDYSYDTIQPPVLNNLPPSATTTIEASYQYEDIAPPLLNNASHQ